MPEFVLDHGDATGRATFAALDAFTRGYVEAMFFTECHADNAELDGKTVADLAPCTLVAIVHDCAWFQAQYLDTLQQAYAKLKSPAGFYNENRAGGDYWFTRNGHGVGFWDRGLGDVGKELSAFAKQDGSKDLYAGDDGLLYLA